MAQKNTFNYTSRWKKIDSLTDKGLPKSALAETKIIFDQAKKEGNEPQQLKATLFMIGFQETSRENAGPAGIIDLEKELATAKLSIPAKSILYSMTAEAYWQYYQSIRWKLYNRTAINSTRSTDIDNWSAEDFHARIAELYQASLKEEKMLIATSLNKFEPLIIKGNVRELRPTLFDLLAARALEYFQNEERDISKPAYAFELNDPLIFSKTAVFAKTNFQSTDSSSLYYKAIRIYQRLISLHLEDAKPAALIDADLNRLEFVFNHSTLSDKDLRYREALQEIATRYPNDVHTAQALYMIASQLNQSANSYQPGADSTHRYDRVKAREICEAVLKKFAAIPFDQSEGKVNCYNLLQEILQPKISFEVEKVNLPGKPFRILVSYRNTSAVWVRIMKADQESTRSEYEELFWSELVKQSPLKQWKQSLPDTRDYQSHSVEIPATGLDAGTYRLLISSDERFLPKKSFLSTRKFYSSSISYITGGGDYFVLNRETGEPLQNAKATVYRYNYDFNNRTSSYEKGETYTTDEHGFFNRPANKAGLRESNYRLSVSWNGETLFMDDEQYDYRNYGPDVQKENPVQVFYFLDRSIYRPGQIVYFKGIAVKSEGGNKNAVAEEWMTTVMLKDVNGQLVDSVPVVTNSYGSFSGKFTLPSSGLTGNFILTDNKSNTFTYFSVEEYKRPSFQVSYDTINATYGLNDSLSILGTAMAYAGNSISNAKVSYRVVRQTRFLYPWLYRRWYFPPTAPQEIAHGTMETDATGKFEFKFLLQPDKTVDPNLQPTFDYQVTVNVTDLNGETRSASQTVTAAYQSLYLRSDIPATLESDSLHNLFIRTENLNGSFHPTTVRVSISKLKPVTRLIRNRYWEKPDQHILSYDEYIKLFPNDEFDSESDPATWPIDHVALERTDTTSESGKFPLFAPNESRKLDPGYYKIELLTNDSEGKPVKDIRYIQLTNAGKNSLPNPTYLFTRGSKPVEPGHSTDILLGTTANDIYLIQQLSKTGYKAPDYRYSSISNSLRKFVWGATEEDRGGYGVTYFFVKDNRFFQFRNKIEVPWSNKELSIEYGSYRNKLLPGSEEKWTLKIKGEKGDAVAAEMLASMYDASLDQFTPHNWAIPSIWESFRFSDIWTTSGNFQAIEGNIHWIEREHKAYNKAYDQLPNLVNGINPQLMYRTSGDRDRGVMKSVAMAAPGAMADQEVKAESLEFESSKNADTTAVAETSSNKSDANIQVRRNLNETAFFLPELRTDSSGNISFSFTIPEALTEWKFQAFAHTKELAEGLSSQTVITQKELMVQPNMPRFLREGDRLEISTRVVNLSDSEMTGQVQLLLIDPNTNESVDGWFQNMFPNQYFTVGAGETEIVNFPVQVPFLYNRPVTWRIVARSGNFSDGEENVLPIVTNKALVTESMPLYTSGSGTKEFRFDHLLQSENSGTLQQHALTIEYSSNPAWYAVQSLPYLTDYPYECAEQTWNRYYANSLAAFVANKNPKLRQVFDKWKNTDSTAFLSNLEKNQELKSALLEETPWVLEAKSEAQQRKNIALLFDLNRMSDQRQSAFNKLRDMQTSNGGFAWFNGGPDDRYISNYIVAGVGHLRQLGALTKEDEQVLLPILRRAISYLDQRISEDYKKLQLSKQIAEKVAPSQLDIYALYMRSFFSEISITAAPKTAYDYYYSQLKKNWTQLSLSQKAMAALISSRRKDETTTKAILASLSENAIQSEEFGMYWKENQSGWFWYQAPIETQALLIEAYEEAGKDKKDADAMRTWLLKQKQTQHWESTKATAEACYALLLRGADWISSSPELTISLGGKPLSFEAQQEGTGYRKLRLDGARIDPSMGDVKVEVKNNSAAPSASTAPTWGAVYWQYFEDYDKIKTAGSPLQLVKKLFIEKNTDKGPVLEPVEEGTLLKQGDRITVRIELKSDRDLEYVHMKDLRASGLEPVNVLSGYKWQGGLGYYESTKDLATHFFFNWLPKGSYVFEYPLVVSNKGTFSNGITLIECMYAPEFRAHSNGVKIVVQ